MKHLFLSLLTTALIQALNVVSGILSARYLLPEGRGLMAAAILWPTLFCAVGALSFDQGVLYYTAIRRDSAGRLLTAGVVLATALSAITMVAGYFFLPLILGMRNSEIINDSRIYLLFMPCNLLSLVVINWFVAQSQFGVMNIQRLMMPALSVGSSVICILIGAANVKAFLLAFLAAQLCVTLFGFIEVFRRGTRFGRFGWADVSNILHYGAILHIGALISLAALRVDQTMISLYLPADRLGFYVVAMSAAMMAALATNTMQILAFPKIASQVTRDGKALLVRRYLMFAFVLTIVGAGGVFLISPILLPLFYGPFFDPAVGLVRILVLGTIPGAISSILMAAYRAYGKTGSVVQISLFSFLTSMAALPFLVTNYGLMGAGWAYTINQFATASFALSHLNKATGIHPRDILKINAVDIASITRVWMANRPKLFR